MITKSEYRQAIETAREYELQRMIKHDHLSGLELREMRKIAGMTRFEAEEASGVGYRRIQGIEGRKVTRDAAALRAMRDAYLARYKEHMDRIRFIDLGDIANTLHDLRMASAASVADAMVATGIHQSRIYEYEKCEAVPDSKNYMSLVSFYFSRMQKTIERACVLFGFDRKEIFEPVIANMVAISEVCVVPEAFIVTDGGTDEINAAKTASAVRRERLRMAGKHIKYTGASTRYASI